MFGEERLLSYRKYRSLRKKVFGIRRTLGADETNGTCGDKAIAEGLGKGNQKEEEEEAGAGKRTQIPERKYRSRSRRTKNQT